MDVFFNIKTNMMKFKEFIEESLLLEVLDSKFNVNQHKVYKRLANHLVKQHPNKQVKYMGKEERLDGGGLAHTLIIESEGFNAINWVKAMQEYEKMNEKLNKLSKVIEK